MKMNLVPRNRSKCHMQSHHPILFCLVMVALGLGAFSGCGSPFSLEGPGSDAGLALPDGCVLHDQIKNPQPKDESFVEKPKPVDDAGPASPDGCVLHDQIKNPQPKDESFVEKSEGQESPKMSDLDRREQWCEPTPPIDVGSGP